MTPDSWTYLEANPIPALALFQLHRPVLLDPRLRTYYTREGVLWPAATAASGPDLAGSRAAQYKRTPTPRSEGAMAASDFPPASFTAQDALVAAMVGVSASDENITTKELLSISRMVDTLPIFEGYDRDRLRTIGQTVFDLFTEEDGLDALFGLMRDALPDACARPPTRSAATSPPPTATPSRPSCSSCSSSATSSTSTACTPPPSSAAAPPATAACRPEA